LALPVSADVPDGVYRISTGFYDLETLTRLGDAVELGRLRVAPTGLEVLPAVD
jgi:hypothetical protein